MKQVRTMLAMLLSLQMAALSGMGLGVCAEQRLLYAGFESDTDGFAARGGETTTRTTADAYEGQYSLLIRNRSDAWNGAAVSLDATWISGESYAFSCAVKQNSGAPVTMQLSLQYDDASGSTQYVQIVSSSVPSGSWTVLSQDAYTIPAAATNRYLYIETTEHLCDFYLDAVTSVSDDGSVPLFSYRLGDINHDAQCNAQDIRDFAAYLQGDAVTIYADTADFDGNGRLNAIDLSLLRQWRCNPQFTETTAVTTAATTAAATITTTTATPILSPGQWNNTADISWIDPSKPMVALSFDDGPVGIGNNSTASRIHNALSDSGFHATFFYWGNRINFGNQNEIVQAYERDFEVANHTYSHPYLTNLSASEILHEYNQTADILRGLTGQTAFLVRPPYLAVNDTVKNTLPVPLINCGMDSADWNNASTADMVNRIQAAMQNGTLNGQIVLMHENYETTAAAVEQLCPYLKANGWQVVTVSELFKAKEKEMYAGNVYNHCN